MIHTIGRYKQKIMVVKAAGAKNGIRRRAQKAVMVIMIVLVIVTEGTEGNDELWYN